MSLHLPSVQQLSSRLKQLHILPGILRSRIHNRRIKPRNTKVPWSERVLRILYIREARNPPSDVLGPGVVPFHLRDGAKVPILGIRTDARKVQPVTEIGADAVILQEELEPIGPGPPIDSKVFGQDASCVLSHSIRTVPGSHQFFHGGIDQRKLSLACGPPRPTIRVIFRAVPLNYLYLLLPLFAYRYAFRTVQSAAVRKGGVQEEISHFQMTCDPVTAALVADTLCLPVGGAWR
mmetsp:Transcript_49124/g.91005  ORF Transcript_49124/g.91005 Transcript_49124/m.91005 type:complete len:235 (+) Transcript_49124:202-906(+)